MIKRFIPPGNSIFNYLGTILSFLCYIFLLIITISAWYFWLTNPHFNQKLFICILNTLLSIFMSWIIFKYLIKVKIRNEKV